MTKNYDSYADVSAEELRELFLNDTINTDLMGLDEYERLFGYETDRNEPQGNVLVFCSNGLNQYEKYSRFDHIKPDFNKIVERYEREKRARRRSPKRIITVAAAIAASFALVLTVTAAALGHNIFDLIWSAIDSPNGKSGDESINADFGNIRFYNSVAEMLETENLSILYPSVLPMGYVFTNFEVTDFESDLMIRMLCSEPYVSFTVRIGANNQISDTPYETNGIKYNINDLGEGMYTAEWKHNGDYYTIDVNNRDVISEIIENLKER